MMENEEEQRKKKNSLYKTEYQHKTSIHLRFAWLSSSLFFHGPLVKGDMVNTDVYLWINVFRSMVTTTIESFYIETNTTPIRYILMAMLSSKNYWVL